MVSPHPRESSMDELRQFFLNLESTFVPPRGTDDQKEQHQDQKLGRMIWESTLAQHHANQPAARRRAREAKEAPPVEPFRYCFWVSERPAFSIREQEDERTKFLHCRLYGNDGYKTGEKTFYYYQDQQLRTEIDTVGQWVMESEYNGIETSVDAHQAYMDYRAAYKIGMGKICNHYLSHGDPERVKITERGNACEDIPFLALTCRLILGEMWNLQPARKETKHEDKDFAQRRRYQATVTNFDFFPLYRFLQMLRRLPTGTHIKGALVDIIFEESTEQATYVCRYRNIRRFITKNWLENIPIWGCMTGLRSCSDALDWRAGYKETKIKDQIGAWFYRVRQIVAFYRVKNGVWQETTIPYNKRMDEIMGDPTDWSTIPEDQLISETIDVLSRAILYHCGYAGNWKNQAELEEEAKQSRAKQFQKEGNIAHESEHALVHLVEQYCIRVDRLLREVLGDFYSEWEQLEDQRLVPNDVLF